MKNNFTAIVLATLFAASTAQATTTTISIGFTGSGLVEILGSTGLPAPTDPVTGHFTLTFDPTQSYTNETAGIVLDSLNMPLASPLSFYWDPIGDVLAVGGSSGGGPTSFILGTDDFAVSIINPLQVPQFNLIDETREGYAKSLWQTRAGSVSVSTAPVPEPGTWLLLGSGLAGLAVFRKRFVRK